MEKTLFTYDELIAQLKSTETISMNVKAGYGAIYVEETGEVRRVFRLVGSKLEEVNVKEMVKIIANYLSKHVSVEKLLEDKLLREPIPILLSLNERVERKAKVKPVKGCYSLIVKGKQGPPLELEL